MGKFPEQFAGSLVVGAGGVFFDGKISEMPFFAAFLDVSPPIGIARKPPYPFVSGRPILSHFPHTLVVLRVIRHAKICSLVVQPVKIPVINMDFPVRNAHDETVQKNSAFAFIPSSSVNGAPMNKSVPRPFGDNLLVIFVIDQGNVIFSEWNFLHKCMIVARLARSVNA